MRWTWDVRLLLFSRKSEHTVNELILLFISAVVFLCLALTGDHIYALLIIFGLLLIFHYFHEAMREEEDHVKIVPLICLSCAYLVFFAVFRGWISLLMLPYLINIHITRNHKTVSKVIVLLVPDLLFIIAQIIDDIVIVSGNELTVQRSWLGILILTLNSALSILINTIVSRLSAQTDNLRNAISAASVNELSERADKRELMVKQYIVERNIRLEERERISLNIHNAVGHTISTAITSLDASRVLMDIEPGKAVEKLDVARNCISQGLDFVRQAVRMIDFEDETVDSSDLISAMATHVEHFRSVTNISISHNLSNKFDFDMPIPRIHAEFLTTSLLELLSNCRHGNATVYSVALDLDTSHMRLVVSDNGTVFTGLPDEERVECLEKGFGLKKIEKHVTRFGGRFKLSYSGGFTVDLMIPIIKE
jgi:signal transduction histidine kinase